MTHSKSAMIIASCVLILFFIAMNANAQQITSEQFSSEFSHLPVDYGKVIFATIFLIILIVAALFIAKKFRFNNINNQGLIQVVYSYPISAKDKLMIVKVAHEYLLLSASSTGMRKLHTLDKDYIDELVANKTVNNNDFANIFMNVLGKRTHV